MVRRKIAIEPPYPLIGDFLYQHVTHHKARHRTYRQNDAAKKMHISATGLSNMINGLDKPSPEECLVLAHYYDFPLEDLLRVCGYPTVRDLVAFTETLSPKTEDGILEKEFILDFLGLVFTPDWQNLDWSSPWKAAAEMHLARDTDRYTKVYSYAQQVYGWDLERKHAKHTHTKSLEFSMLAQVS